LCSCLQNRSENATEPQQTPANNGCFHSAARPPSCLASVAECMLRRCFLDPEASKPP
jgi:hypothetical protein